VGLTPEVIADPEERLSVRSQVVLLDEAAIALKDDRLGFTLALDFDPRELGLLYYVTASSRTLGDALKRVARYSQITNEALVVRYQEGNRLLINLSYSDGSEPRTAALLDCSLSIGRHFRNAAVCRNESGVWC
jgi:hypothetical protein